jgi:NADH dehydrogenase
MKPHLLIVGGGFGGLKAARELAHTELKITLLDKSNHHLFQPLLYQVATASLSPAAIASPIRNILQKQENIEVLMEEVISVNAKEKTLSTKNRSLSFDYLILATGSRHSYFGRDEWEKFAPGLKTIPDATSIRQKILKAFEQAEGEKDPLLQKQFLTFCIIGGGPTGVELAGAIAELAHRALASDFRNIDPKTTRIVLIEAGPRILASFPEALSLSAQKKLESLGVEVRTSSRVEALKEHELIMNQTPLQARTILWAAGVIASPAGKWLGTEVDKVGRVKVSPDLSVPGHPEIFVIGDTASVTTSDGKTLPGVAPVALQEGQYVARLIEAKLEGKKYQPFQVPRQRKFGDGGQRLRCGSNSRNVFKRLTRLVGLGGGSHLLLDRF